MTSHLTGMEATIPLEGRYQRIYREGRLRYCWRVNGTHVQGRVATI